MTHVMSTINPHVPAHTAIREFSLRAIILGGFLGFIFAVANAYLALKIGQTVSASIPAAILSMAILRICFRDATILENNIVQTVATVGEGLAAGVVTGAMIWIRSAWVPRLVFRRDSFNTMFSYGSKMALAQLGDQIFKNLYVLIIGRLFPLTEVDSIIGRKISNSWSQAMFLE